MRSADLSLGHASIGRVDGTGMSGSVYYAPVVKVAAGQGWCGVPAVGFILKRERATTRVARSCLHVRHRARLRGPGDSRIASGFWMNVESGNCPRKTRTVLAQTAPWSWMACFSTAPERDTRESTWMKVAIAPQDGNWTVTTIGLSDARPSAGKWASTASSWRRRALTGCGGFVW